MNFTFVLKEFSGPGYDIFPVTEMIINIFKDPLSVRVSVETGVKVLRRLKIEVVKVS